MVTHLACTEISGVRFSTGPPFFIMKLLGYTKRKGKLHSADSCSICSNVEKEFVLDSSNRRAKEKIRIKKQIKEYDR